MNDGQQNAGAGPPPMLPATADPFASRTAPPTTQRPIFEAARARRWPLVFGIISAILGGVSALWSAWQLAQSYFMDAMLSGFPGQEAVLAAHREWRGPMAMVLVPSILLAAMLLYGGILLIRRKPSARPLLLTWSALRVVQGLALAVVTGLMQSESMQAAMAALPNQPGAAAAAAAAPFVGSGMAVFTAMYFAVWAIAWPLVVLIWLTRRTVKADVQAWRRPDMATSLAAVPPPALNASDLPH
jgi:hypothetical protein